MATDPYPIWKRLRDERPFYYNERYDFYALSRFDEPEGSVMVLLTGSANRDERWEVDGDNAVQARTSTVRGWECLPVFSSSRRVTSEAELER